MKYLKFLGFVFFILSYFCCCLPLYPIFIFFPNLVRKILINVVSVHSKAMLWVLDINVTAFNIEYSRAYSNFLVVSNHLSYLDILILASKLPSCYVTSLEVKRTPFLGQLTQLAGCLYVDRNTRQNLSQEVSELREALNSGFNVTIFPEATSTNGEEVLRFRRPLFEASIATGKPILPVTINYKTINSKEVSFQNRDYLCWYGDMEFFGHFITLLTQKNITVEVVLAEPFLPTLLPLLDLAQISHQKVSESFRTFKPLPGRQYDQNTNL